MGASRVVECSWSCYRSEHATSVTWGSMASAPPRSASLGGSRRPVVLNPRSPVAGFAPLAAPLAIIIVL